MKKKYQTSYQESEMKYYQRYVVCLFVKEQFQMSLKTTMIECKFPVWNFFEI